MAMLAAVFLPLRSQQDRNLLFWQQVRGSMKCCLLIHKLMSGIKIPLTSTCIMKVLFRTKSIC